MIAYVLVRDANPDFVTKLRALKRPEVEACGTLTGAGTPPYRAFVKVQVADVPALQAFSAVFTGAGAKDFDSFTTSEPPTSAPKITSPVPGETVAGLLLAGVPGAKAAGYISCARGRAHVHGTAVLTPVDGTPQCNTAVVVWGTQRSDLASVAQDVRTNCGMAAGAMFLPLLVFIN